MIRLRSLASRPELGGVLATLAIGVAAGPGSAQVLYDVDFSSPPHTVGEAPATGAGATPRSTVTSVSNEPEVVAASGALDTQPLEFDEGFESVTLDLTDLDPATTYLITANVIVHDETQEFAYVRVSLEAPSIRNVTFFGSGDVTQVVAGDDESTIGTFTPGVVVAVEILVDLGGDAWSIRLDGELAHTGSFGGATAIDRVNLTSTGTSAFIVRGAVDDVMIEADPLLPTTAMGWDGLKERFRR